MAKILTRRELNRATLARQLLLERSELPVVEAAEHLLGLQAQTPHSWYVGFWSRLAGFQPKDAADALVDRNLVRIALMRSTIHLVSARDAMKLRPFAQAAIDRDLFNNFIHGKAVKELDVAEVVSRAEALLAPKPLSNKELGERLGEIWPGVEPRTLVYIVRCRVPLIQVPPRGVWGRSGTIAHTSIQSWLGSQADTEADRAAIVLRYLAAFGPASIKDIQTWAGVTRLKEVVDPLRPELEVFRDEQGVELFDLPGAPRPGADVPAPSRFLYDFDNLLLSHADRSRFVSDPVRHQKYLTVRPTPQLVLNDGLTAGEWKVSQDRDNATLTILPYNRLSKRELADLRKEASGLLEFLAPEVARRDVVVQSP